MQQKVFCLDCNKYFESLENYKKEHDDKISFKVMNIQHNYLLENNALAYFAKLFSDNSKIIDIINKQNIEIQKIASKLNYYEDAFKNDVNFECNIRLKNIENKIKGKCLMHFFPKCIKFRIECEGNIIFKGKKEFEIEIIFPFKKSEIKMSSIEKIKGCIFTQKVMNLSEQEAVIHNNYSSAIIQNNYITSVKLMRNYYANGYLEKNNIDVIINGFLTFSSFKYDMSLPFVLFNITQKKFISYENYQWKFSENCFQEDGNINANCLINLEFNLELSEIYIKNKFKYLKNEPNFVATDKNEAKFHFNFINKFYGIITIDDNKGQFLSSDEETGEIKLSQEENYYIIYNI